MVCAAPTPTWFGGKTCKMPEVSAGSTFTRTAAILSVLLIMYNSSPSSFLSEVVVFSLYMTKIVLYFPFTYYFVLFNIFLPLFSKLLYGNCWVTAWTTDWAPGERTRSALGAQVKAIQLWSEGVEPGCTSLRPHLRADCHWGRITGWRSVFLWSFFWEPRSSKTGEHFLFVTPFYCANPLVIAPPVSPFWSFWLLQGQILDLGFYFSLCGGRTVFSDFFEAWDPNS